MFQGWPRASPGQRIGLLGGSFDPAHEGHAAITCAALARFRLDRVWWLVSPGNPLKPAGPAPMSDRLAAARALMVHPRVTVTDIEAQLGTRYTADTLDRLLPRYPGVRFVWLMGSDNLAGFHHWENWARIMRLLPVGVLARPGARARAGLAPAARAFATARLPEGRAAELADRPAPAWCLVQLPLVDASSTALRHAGLWRGAGLSEDGQVG